MKLWMSSEMQADLLNSYPRAERAIERAVNQRMLWLPLNTDLRQWAHVAIIVPWKHDEDYPELKRKNARQKSLEFRLNIDHSKFLSGSPAEQQLLILDSLERSVRMMGTLGIDEPDCQALLNVLSDVRTQVPLE